MADFKVPEEIKNIEEFSDSFRDYFLYLMELARGSEFTFKEVLSVLDKMYYIWLELVVSKDKALSKDIDTKIIKDVFSSRISEKRG